MSQVTLLKGRAFLNLSIVNSASQNSTGWSKETVNCNFFLTDLKMIKSGITQPFLEGAHREVLIFWCLQRVDVRSTTFSKIFPQPWIWTSPQIGNHFLGPNCQANVWVFSFTASGFILFLAWVLAGTFQLQNWGWGGRMRTEKPLSLLRQCRLVAAPAHWTTAQK